MIRIRHWAATAFACLALTGSAVGPVHAADGPGTGTAPAAGTAPIDDAYLRAGHQGNLTEIAAGQDAQRHAVSACVKSAAATLIRDHTRLDESTRALAGKLGVDLPAAPTVEQQDMLRTLESKAGSGAYDATWLDAMTSAHQKTLARIDNQISTGKVAEVTAAARASRPVVASHLAMVRGGGCHDTATPSAIHAGDGGQAAALAAEVPIAVAVPALAIGGVLVAGVAFWAAALIRRNDSR
ncbi:DUF4142 domain-containing protein [Streptomyces sp. SP18CS02]|uniref:DUF4142 domain-containing protein n=1 Tax=Streptomyces sp. SP18CS02 TaxID=3002531 RepID=UPI002E788A8C|nr:DUF4142 domain-containing protein [Streptomyces sp. SP18CS02]MEE1753692.1 DUF4142 domain-containing protein [Streptomyces sp. SP18CS02]